MTPEGDGLMAGLFARGPVAEATGDPALLQAMLDFELALVRALARCGLAPVEAAQELAEVCNAGRFDVAELGRRTGEQGTPVPGLLAMLRERLPESARAHLHRGATSQDVMDTALMLVSRRALSPLLADLARARHACAELAEAHRGTLMAGRTLMQQALPISFGAKAAGWLEGLGGVARELARVRDAELAVQLGGAAGTLAALGDQGLDVVAALADELGLLEPALPWHTIRTRPALLAGALGAALGVMGKVATDVVLLAQTEVGEGREGNGEGRGGSSTMPHKRNPVRAIAVRACAAQAPGLVASILGAMGQEHERAAGDWQSEWEPLRTLLRLAGTAADALAGSLEGFAADPARMRANLELTGGAVMSESVVSALAERLGRSAATELVGEVAEQARRRERALGEALLESEAARAAIGAEALARALDPSGYLGVSEQLIDRALARHRASGSMSLGRPPRRGARP